MIDKLLRISYLAIEESVKNIHFRPKFFIIYCSMKSKQRRSSLSKMTIAALCWLERPDVPPTLCYAGQAGGTPIQPARSDQTARVLKTFALETFTARSERR